jgi:hypothetical protein
MMGTPKKHSGLLGPKIVVVNMWRDFDFSYQTHEVAL